MNVVYINHFDDFGDGNDVVTVPSSPNATCPSGDPVVAAVISKYDAGLWVRIFPELPPVKLKLGPMRAGSSSPALGSIRYIAASPVAPKQFDPGGLLVTVCQNPAVLAVEQSQTLYVVPGNALEPLTPFTEIVIPPFATPGTLTAELIFDQPDVSGGQGDEWAVGLNFKKNGQNDGGIAADGTPVDLNFGPTCQFSGSDPGVTVKLNKVQNPQSSMGNNYQDLSSQTFTLTTSMSIDQGGNVSGSAALVFGGNDFPSPLKAPPAGFDLNAVNAVGVGIVSLKNSYDWVRVRLRSFTLSAQPVFPLVPWRRPI